MSNDASHPANPYVGLRPFESADSLYFFGRSRQVHDLLARLETSRFLAVVGGSGCGKSSLVRAGLVPVLEGGFLVEGSASWLVAAMRPGDRPRERLCEALDRLEAAGGGVVSAPGLDRNVEREGEQVLLRWCRDFLARRGANLLLLVDQFEELFQSDAVDGVVRPSDESLDFVRLMLALAAEPGLPVYVVMTMRSDFLGDCALFAGLAEAMNRSQYLVPRLDIGQRREAIAGPAQLSGQQLAPSLLDRLLSERLETHDDLPVLQHALRRTWEAWLRRGGTGTISTEDYQAIGTVHGALNRDAEEALDADHRPAADIALTMRVFQALTVTDVSNRRVRRPTRLGELAAITGAPQLRIRGVVLERFASPDRSFLVVPSEDDPLIDLSHESLIRQWQRLREWTDAEARSAASYRRLADVSLRYHAGEAGLYPPADVAVATRWREVQQPTEPWARRYEILGPTQRSRLSEALEFLDASARAHRSSRRRRVTFTAAAFALVALAAVVAFWQRNLALAVAGERDAQRQRAETNEWRALTSERKATNALESLRVESGRNATLVVELQGATNQLARVNAELQTNNRILLDVQESLNNTVFQLRQATNRLEDATAKAQRGAEAERLANRERTRALFESYLHGATLLAQGEAYGEASRELVKSHHLEDQIRPDRVAPGRVGTRNLLEWHLRTLTRPTMRVAFDAGGPLRDVSVSSDGRWIAAGGEGGMLALYDVSREAPPHRWNVHQGPVAASAFDPGGGWLATAGSDQRILTWSVPDGVAMKAAERRMASPVEAMVLSPNGRWLAAGGREGTVTVWSALSSERGPVFEEATPRVSSLAFSPDSGCLAAALEGSEVRIWEFGPDGPPVSRSSIARRTESFTVLAPPRHLAFAPDGLDLAVGCENGLVCLWNRSGRRVSGYLRGRLSAVGGLTFAGSDDGLFLLAGGSDFSVRALSMPSGDLRWVFDGHAAAITGLAAANGVCYSVSLDGTLRAWSLAASKGEMTLTHVVPRPTSCALSSEGDWLAVGGDGGGLRFVHLGDGRQHGPSTAPHSRRVSKLVFTRDGRRLVSAGFDGKVLLWDTASGRLMSTLCQQPGPVHAIAVSPDDRWLAVGGGDTMAALAVNPPRVTRPDLRGVVRLMPLDGEPTAAVPVSAGPVYTVAFDAGGERLLAAGEDGDVQWWMTKDFPRDTKTVRGSPGVPLGWAAFRPGQTPGVLATGGGDGVIRLESLSDGGPKLPLIGHSDTIVRLAFGPDGGQLLSAGADGEIIAWDLGAETPRRLFTIRPGSPRRGLVQDMAFVARTESGRARLAVPLTSGQVVVHDLGAIYADPSEDAAHDAEVKP